MAEHFIYYIILTLTIIMLVMVARKIKIAYPIVLLLGGLAISFIPGTPAVSINPQLIFVVFLPPLLYDAAWQTSWKELWKWRRVISSFAFIIVIVTALVIALISVRIIPGFTLAMGFLLGAIISPPDAVSATSILSSIKVPRRLRSIIEGESLLNDAASLLVFRFSLIAITTGSFVFQHAASNFIIMVVLGIATGLAVGMVLYAIHRWLPTTTNLDILLSVITPYIMYIVAERLHVSGVLAVVSGGLFLSARSHTILQYRSRLRGSHVWSTLAFALNGFIFLMIGLQLPIIVRGLESVGLGFAIYCGVAISLSLVVLRLICTFGASAFTIFISRFITTADSRPGWKGPILFGWAGMRGVVSLAAALSIPITLKDGTPFPHRNLILFITFCVILVTLVLQGLTLPWMIRIVKMEDTDAQLSDKQQELLVRKEMSEAALQILEKKFSEQSAANPWLQSMKARFQTDIDMLGPDPVVTDLAERKKHFRNYRSIALELLDEQRTRLQHLNQRDDLDDNIIRKFHSLLDMEEEKVRTQFRGDQTADGAEA